MPRYRYMQFSKTLYFALALLVLSAVQASANDYEIEVIIFEQPNSEDTELEYWNFSEEHLQNKRLALREMEKSESAYNVYGELKKLADFEPILNDGNMPVLVSARWIQPAFFFQNAPVISLGSEGSRLAHAYFRVYKTSLLFAEIALQLSPFSPIIEPNFSWPENAAEEPLAIDHSLAEAVKEPEFAFNHELLFDSWPDIDSEVPKYFLLEKRRIKFNEVHYFDHPAFGVILGIWSVASSASN